MDVTSSAYRIVHNWVERRLGKPKLCENCKTTESKRFEWANISQEYKREVSDWKRLCTSCHRKFDFNLKRGEKTHCIYGHELTPENTYNRTRQLYGSKVGYYTDCKICRTNSRLKSKAKRKEAIL